MKKLQGGKILVYSLVLLAALALVTWAFVSFKNGIFASTTKKKEVKEKEIDIKVLNEDKDKSESSGSSEDDEKDIFSRPVLPDFKEFDDVMKEFEDTQREMLKLMEEMRKNQNWIMRDFMKDVPDDDFMKRDDWDVTPRFRGFPRSRWFGIRPDDRMMRWWRKDLFDTPGTEGVSTAIDVHNDKDKVVIKCDLPGMDKEKIGVTLKGRLLTIKGTREATKEQTQEKDSGRIMISERSSGSFSRSISLPQNIDPEKITSKYENGVLEIIVPKTSEKEPEEKKIIIH